MEQGDKVAAAILSADDRRNEAPVGRLSICATKPVIAWFVADDVARAEAAIERRTG